MNKMNKYRFTQQEKRLLLVLGITVSLMVLAGMKLAFDSIILKPGITVYDHQLFLSQKNQSILIQGDAYVPERRVLALKSGTEIFVLHSSDLEAEPLLMTNWAELNQFYQRQTHLFNFIQRAYQKDCDPCLFWFLSSGHLVPTEATKTTFSGLKTPFILYMLLFVVISVVAVLSWFYSAERLAAFYFVVMGVSLALMTWAEAVCANRCLVLEGSIFQILTSMNVLGMTFFVAGMSGLVAVYPQKVCRFPDLFVLLAVVGFSLIFFQILPDEIAGNFTVIAFFLVVMLLLLARQILSVRNDPVLSVKVKWLWLSILLGIIGVTGTAYLPYMLNFEEGVEPTYGLMGLFITYLMLSVSLAYARLFEINAWWSRLWYLALWSFVAILVAMFLHLSVGFDLLVSVLISLAVFGWLAVPFRKWLISKRQENQVSGLEINTVVPRLIGSDLATIEKVFKGAVLSRIRPQWIRQIDKIAGQVILSKDANELFVPNLSGNLQYQFGLPENGRRLYTLEDEEWVQQLYEVAKSIEVSFRQKEQGVKDERQRIRRDLHDEMTQEIISLLRHAESAETRKKAGDLMQSLKNVLSALSSDLTPLEDVLTQAQAQMREKLTEAGFGLLWREQLIDGRICLSPRQVSNLLKILRESISNVIKYAEVGPVRVGVRQFENSLEIHIENQVAKESRDFDSNQLGIPNMKKRAEELGGYIYVVNLAHEFQLLISIPLVLSEEKNVP